MLETERIRPVASRQPPSRQSVLRLLTSQQGRPGTLVLQGARALSSHGLRISRRRSRPRGPRLDRQPVVSSVFSPPSVLLRCPPTLPPHCGRLSQDAEEAARPPRAVAKGHCPPFSS